MLTACDWVLSRDEHDANGELVWRRVLRRFVRQSLVLNLHVRGQLIGTTAEHPFFVLGAGWAPAHSLRIGDVLLSHDGKHIAVDGVADSGRIETVYNVEVEHDHTYFVGCDQTWGWTLWAHNTYEQFRDRVVPVARLLQGQSAAQIDARLMPLYQRFVRGELSDSALLKELKTMGVKTPAERTGIVTATRVDQRAPTPGELSGEPHAHDFPRADLVQRAIDTGNPQGSWANTEAVYRAVAQWDPGHANVSRAHSVPIAAGDGVVIHVATDGTVTTVPATRAFVRLQGDGTIHSYPIDTTHALYNLGPP